jgi:hypothetical protein
VSFYLEILKSRRIFVLQTKAINNMKRTNHASAFAAKYANNLYWNSNGTITKAEAFKEAYAFYRANKAAIIAELEAQQTPAEQPTQTVAEQKQAKSELVQSMMQELLQYVVTQANVFTKTIIGGIGIAEALKIAYARYQTNIRRNAVVIKYIKLDGEERTANAEAICELKEREAKNGNIMYMENIPGQEKPQVRLLKATQIICVTPAQPRKEQA